MRVVIFVALLLIEIDSLMANECYDVVIIGCGSSGIGAAVELISHSNMSLLIIEARDRVGGRAYTDQNSLDFPFDIGAEWIHEYDSNNPLYQLHEKLKTELDTDEYIQLFDTERIACFDTTNGSMIDSQIALQAQETVNKLFTKHFDGVDVSVDDVIRDEFDRLDQNQHKRLVKAILISMEEIFAADLDQLSAKQYLQEPGWSLKDESENNLVLKRGYGRFLQRIADHYQLPIILNTIVTQIDTRTSSDIVQISTSNGQKITAKYVIITIPLGCLKQQTIVFQPPLPKWKLDAIKQFGFGNTDKIIVQFDRVFWNTNWTIIYLVDAPFPFALCNTNKRTLSFMIGGRSAVAMENQKDETIITQILNNLQQVFTQEKFHVEHYIISRWTQEKFSLGSYSYFNLNSTVQTMEMLAKECAENRLFWAGEHTSQGASVHTAFATGQRAAHKILVHHSQ